MAVTRLDPSALDLTLGRLRLIPEPAILAMADSLRTKGQFSPLVAAAREGGRPMLVDGFARQRAAVHLKLERVEVDVLPLTPIQMKVQMYLRNRERGLKLLEECRLVRDLVEGDRLAQVEVADLLERHPSWVSRRLAIGRSLSPNLMEEGVIARLPGGCIRRLARLPERNQEAVWASVSKAGPSAGDATFLLDLWEKAPNDEARAWVVAHPAEAIATARRRPPVPDDPRLGHAGAEAWRALEGIGRAGHRVVARIAAGLGDVGADGRAALARARAEAADASTAAFAAVDAWLVRP